MTIQEQISVLTINPGDILVVRVDTALEINERKHMERIIRRALFDAGHRGEVAVLVLEKGMDLEVVRREQGLGRPQ